MKNDGDPKATRQRLLEAAGEIFAEHGFRCATVREICLRAGANVASVNYHFGDKERLYAEVFRFAHASALDRHPYTTPVMQERPPAERLVYFIEAFMQRMFDCGRPAWHGRLIAREMAEPTGALNLLIDTSIRPQFNVLTEIVAALLPKGTPHKEAELCGRSVLGQCLFYHFGRVVVERLDNRVINDPARLKQLAAHITRFSLAAIRHWKDSAR